MAKQYDDTNRGALFVAREKKGENSPDYTGSIDVGGTKYWLSGWKRTSKAGAPYLSLAVTPDDGKRAERAKPKAAASSDFVDDEIPF